MGEEGKARRGEERDEREVSGTVVWNGRRGQGRGCLLFILCIKNI